MTANFHVVLDACVLIPMPLADTLLRLAAGPRLYLPRWTDHLDPKTVVLSLEEQAAAIKKPIEYVLDRLRVNAFRFVDIIRSNKGYSR